MRFALPLLLAAATLPCLASLAEPVDVFVAGTEGYHTFRIPSLIRAHNGNLLAFAEGRRNSASDTGDIDLVMRRSTDNGRSWGPLELVWSDDDNTCGNPCPVVDARTGSIWLFATHNLGQDRERDIVAGKAVGTRMPWLLVSHDHGHSWSPAQQMEHLKDPFWGWYATGPGVGIQIENGPHAGRLVIPCVHSYPDPAGSIHDQPFEYGSHVVYSDDHGQTWQLGGLVRPKTNECQVVELATPPGRLLLNLRSYHGLGRRAESTSDDGGLNWSAVTHHDDLIEPLCQASIIRHRWPDAAQAGLLVFANPASSQLRQRVRMTVRTSSDEGRSWSAGVLLHEAFSAYSSLVPLGPDTVGCLFERGATPRRRSYELISFATVPLSQASAPQP